MGGKSARGGQTTTVNIPGPTPEETALTKRQVELAELQLAEVRRQNEAFAEVFPLQKQLLEAQLQSTLALLREQVETPGQAEIRRVSEQRTLAFLRGEAPQLLPAERKLIETAFGEARATGTEELRRFGEELAASRGMRLTDSPIGGELLRQKQLLERGLGGAEAQAKFAATLAPTLSAETIREFQENLRLTAQQNRAVMAGRGAGFAGGAGREAGATLEGLVSGMRQERIAGASRRSRFSTFEPFDWGGFAAGVVQSAAGGAALGFASKSSARFKRAIAPLDRDEYDEALRKVRETPITRWRYKWETDRGPAHIGPILELSPPEISDDGLRVNLLDYTGLVHAGLKGLDRRVAELSRRLAEGARREGGADA